MARNREPRLVARYLMRRTSPADLTSLADLTGPARPAAAPRKAPIRTICTTRTVSTARTGTWYSLQGTGTWYSLQGSRTHATSRRSALRIRGTGGITRHTRAKPAPWRATAVLAGTPRRETGHDLRDTPSPRSQGRPAVFQVAVPFGS